LLKDKDQIEIFVDFIQSIVENKHRIIDTATNHEVVEIFKE